MSLKRRINKLSERYKPCRFCEVRILMNLRIRADLEYHGIPSSLAKAPSEWERCAECGYKWVEGTLADKRFAFLEGEKCRIYSQIVAAQKEMKSLHPADQEAIDEKKKVIGELLEKILPIATECAEISSAFEKTPPGFYRQAYVEACEYMKACYRSVSVAAERLEQMMSE